VKTASSFRRRWSWNVCFPPLADSQKVRFGPPVHDRYWRIADISVPREPYTAVLWCRDACPGRNIDHTRPAATDRRPQRVSPGEARLLEPAGIINSTYALDAKRVLRVPRDHPAHVEQARREAVTIPAVVAAGVRTASLLAYDDSCEILPVPYLTVERLEGRNLEAASLDPATSGAIWRALGRDLARLHATPAPPALRAFPSDEYDAMLTRDPRELAEQRASEGGFSPLEARWLIRWLDSLPPPPDRESSRRLVHADVQMSNLMIESLRDRYRAIFDWGCARVADT
jgi:hygromycin-B 7''-O-kinase